jgi:hypothetical protein
VSHACETTLLTWLIIQAFTGTTTLFLKLPWIDSLTLSGIITIISLLSFFNNVKIQDRQKFRNDVV